MREGELQTQGLRWLNANGWFAFRLNTAGIYDTRTKSYRKRSAFAISGVSDTVAIRDGITVWIEFKTETGSQSHDQKLFENQITKNKGHYILVRSLGGMIDEINKISASKRRVDEGLQ